MTAPASDPVMRTGGIEPGSVPASLAEVAVRPGDPGYEGLTSTYFRGGSPALVLLPRTVEEVVDSVAVARRNPRLPLGVRSGGHGLSGRSTNDGGIVIDLRRLNAIEVVDTATRRVRVGPGARWREVADALQPHGWALTSGDSGGVGVGGLATQGGIGFLAREHGLTIDHLVAARVVLADGSVVVASEDEHPELFWALRGAGSNFGIVVEFEFVVDEVGEVGLAIVTQQVADPAAFLVAFGEAASGAPRDTTAQVLVASASPGPLTAMVVVMVDAADPDVIVDRLRPFFELAPVLAHQVVITPYASVMRLLPEREHQGRGEPAGRSGLLASLTPAFAAEAAALLASGSAHLFQVRSLGGATEDVPADATAFAHRDARFQVNAVGADPAAIDRHWNAIRPHLAGIYLSFESDQDPARLHEAFPPATLRRLRALKRVLDPGNLFRDNFNVDPHDGPAGAASG